MSNSHPDPDKFFGDKSKLDLFITQLRTKLLVNADHYIRLGTKTEQNKLSYSISRLGGDAFAHVKPYVDDGVISLPNVARMIELLKTRFGDVDPAGRAKRDLFKWYQTNKDLDTFLNTFLLVARRPKSTTYKRFYVVRKAQR